MRLHVGQYLLHQKLVGGVGAAGATGAGGAGGATRAVGAGATELQWSCSGAVGDMGAVGVVGATGAMGAMGDVGATGAVGARGATGAKGVAGGTARHVACNDIKFLFFKLSYKKFEMFKTNTKAYRGCLRSHRYCIFCQKFL